MTDNTAFTVGTVYYSRAVSSWDTIATVHIVKRTAQTVTVDYHGKEMRRKVQRFGSVESFSLNSAFYFTADKTVEG